MKVVFTSFGSTGDVQPFLALAWEFRNHGHEPLLAFSPNFMPLVRRLGMESVPLGPELDPALIRGVGTALVRVNDPAEQVRHFLNAVVPASHEMYRQLMALCEGADALVSSPFQIVSRMVYDKLRLPFVSVHMSQFGALGTKVVRDVSAPLINECRSHEGLGPLDDPLGSDGTSPDLALYAVSKQVLRAPASWPEHHRVVGFFFLDDAGWAPPPELREFIEAGDKPIVFSFGSMVHDSPEQVTDMILGALDGTGRRAIIQQGWSGLGNRKMPPHVFTAGFAPHSWLFPRAACVVHHGGAGTTAATFKAGVPSVVVPHTLDQPIWGEFAKALGCAGAVIPFARLSAEKLGEAITKTLGSPRHTQAASAVSKVVGAEQGVGTARRLIEELVSNAGSRKALNAPGQG
jgi:sterol 3beta-glucosyltransferase